MTEKQVFDFTKVSDFDEHIECSIPGYKNLTRIFQGLATEFMGPGGHMVDLGCTTGAFIESMPKVPDAEYTGVDIADCRPEESKFDFCNCSALEYLRQAESPTIITSLFCLQFMGDKERKATLERLLHCTKAGTKVLIAEKVFLKDSRLNTILHRQHMQYKRASFTTEEILKKDSLLSGSMFCRTEEEIMQEFKPFGTVEKVWQSYQFCGWYLSK